MSLGVQGSFGVRPVPPLPQTHALITLKISYLPWLLMPSHRSTTSLLSWPVSRLRSFDPLELTPLAQTSRSIPGLVFQWNLLLSRPRSTQESSPAASASSLPNPSSLRPLPCVARPALSAAHLRSLSSQNVFANKCARS